MFSRCCSAKTDGEAYLHMSIPIKLQCILFVKVASMSVDCNSPTNGGKNTTIAIDLLVTNVRFKRGELAQTKLPARDRESIA